MTIYGLKPIDLSMIVAYFGAIVAIGFWASRRVRNETDFFLGGRRFGKGLLTMHWLCTGTHSEMAVQVAGATARVGLGGIWYQWMWLFSTPFYWLIAPITRRLRVTTTGDFFRIRYGRGLEILYTIVALIYLALSIALLLRGAGAAISGATGGQVPTERSVIVLSILFSTYVMAGGLVAAAFTDVLQGVMIIALSVMLVPNGLARVGGLAGLHDKLAPSMFAITAPEGAREGDPWFVLTLSLLGLVGVVVQPHVMSATGSGKTETEARVGMVYGNLIKRLLTIAWAFTGLIAIAAFPEILSGLDPADPRYRMASESLFGRATQQFLGDGWRGLMIACLIAGVTSAETFMVVGSALFTRNIYGNLVRNASPRHELWVGRLASGSLLAVGIVLAFKAQSVTQLVLLSVQVIGLLGAAFWLGTTWRRANVAGVWASAIGGLAAWLLMSYDRTTGAITAPDRPSVSLTMLGAEFGLLILVSLLTRQEDASRLDPFFARLHTPVGKEQDVACDDTVQSGLHADASLGLNGSPLDYGKSSRFAYARLQQIGIELPIMTRMDWAGFLVAWVMVGGLIGLLVWLAGLGR
jgi:Na+/proline symporter